MRRPMSRFCFINLTAMMTGLLMFSGMVPPTQAAGLEMAPINPAFTDFMRHVPLKQGEDPLSKTMGYIPAPIDRSHLSGIKQPLTLVPPAALPASYDLRTLGKVTPVRDQGSCGSCWSFGAMASLESSLLTAETRDFSENNMKNTHSYDWDPCFGGNMFLSTAYLMRWSGPVYETDDPYQPNTNPSPSGLTVQKHSQNIIHLPMRASATDNNVIKNALVTYGAVTMSYFHDNAFYNRTYFSYYYTGTSYSNHEVAIVGWDDNFDRNRFSPNIPPANGAFIVKNSWGTSWGESGYFYISYYDTKMGYEDLAVFTKPERTTNYARMYSYDPLGVVNMLGFNSTTAWFANIFTAQGNDRISAVSFYIYSPNSPYELYVYRDLTNVANPRTGTLVASKSGTLADPGYLTIPLGSSVSVTAGQTFSVVVKLTTPGNIFPIPAEYAYPTYSSAATASPGQSFYSATGTTWSDATSFDSTLNVCIKAYAAGKRSSADFDGDGKSDIAVWRPGNGGWFIIPSSSSVPYMVSYGDATDKTVPGDYDGDGKTDIAVWRQASGTWFITNSSNGTQTLKVYGSSTDIPVPADFDGDGKTDVAVWRPTSGTWFITNSSDGTQTVKVYGSSTDIPVPGDFDGDGRSDVAVWRPASGTWFISNSSNDTQTLKVYGSSSDIPVPADFDGDGRSDVAVWRPASGTWFISNSSNGTQTVKVYGSSTDTPVPTDFDGDGRSDVAVWRPASGTWFIYNSSDASQTVKQWGESTDQPVKED